MVSMLTLSLCVCVCLQCDMQKLTVEELKRLLYDTFCDHLSMKDIENIIMTEENHIENPEDCQVDIDSKEQPPYMYFNSHSCLSVFLCYLQFNTERQIQHATKKLNCSCRCIIHILSNSQISFYLNYNQHKLI